MNTIRKKIYLINKISNELKLEFPNISLEIKKKIKSNIIFEIYFLTNKNNINKFDIIDGGRKDRIIRKTRNLLKLSNILYKNHKNIFVI
jgi:hypothetical protein